MTSCKTENYQVGDIVRIDPNSELYADILEYGVKGITEKKLQVMSVHEDGDIECQVFNIEECTGIALEDYVIGESTDFVAVSNEVKINIKRIDKNLPLPKYETAGSVGFDLICRESVEIQPQSIRLIPANIVVETPPGYMLMICLRSSTPREFGLMMPQGVGIIDNDYCGEEDELQIQVYNFSNLTVNVERGHRIAQAIFVRVDTAQWNELEQMHLHSRGGFGSTNK